MKILLISCVFPPEPVVSARTSLQIAEKLIEMGHQVKVLAPIPSRPLGQVYPQYKRRLFHSETSSQSYELIRCFSFFSSTSSLPSRFLENISFGLSVFFVLLFSGHADIVYGNTWPIFAQGLLVLVCKLRGMPLTLSIQDIYPESLFAQNRVEKSAVWFFGFLRWLDIVIARNCRALIVISEEFKKIYVQDRGLEGEKIHVIPNWIDSDQSSVMDQDYSIRQQHHIPQDAFLVTYGGNIGVAAGVNLVIQAFQHLLDQENIYLLIAGAGSMLPECQRLVNENNLTRVNFHSPWSIEETFAVLKSADLLILPTRAEQAYVSVPSKLLSYMLSECCILTVAPSDSEIAEIIVSSGAGWVLSTNNSNALANRILEITKCPLDERISKGQAGRNFALRYFSKSSNLPKVIEILEQSGGHCC
jgi:colanic acid biosynthesis glycosyl transferase WcaI